MGKSRGVKQLATAHQLREGGGFIVRRPIGDEVSHCGPFLLLDHWGPVEYGPGEAVGAPDHPHRGFETVTYVIAGSFQHKDMQRRKLWLFDGGLGAMDDGWVRCGAF